MKTWPVIIVPDDLHKAVKAKLKTSSLTLSEAVRQVMAEWAGVEPEPVKPGRPRKQNVHR